MMGKEIITRTNIKKYLLKQEIISLMVLAVIVPIFFWTLFTEDNRIARILVGNCILLGLFGIGESIYNIIKIRNNTLFQIRTDILLDKKEYICAFHYRRPVDRLIFQKGYYNIHAYRGHTQRTIYDGKTVFNTASIGDSFTLICVRKKIVLAFNNQCYQIQED